jgi:hypothetical protein
MGIWLSSRVLNPACPRLWIPSPTEPKKKKESYGRGWFSKF